jgi:transcriptional regulator with XRE-family HTH domain
MGTSYWWSGYGRFTPGEGVLPHMGEVIVEYRLRRGWNTQAELAAAAGVSQRAVTDWESKAMIRDPDRRIFLARLLKIPPALLGIDWRPVFYEDNTGAHSRPLPQDQVWLEDSYHHYEDTLALTWDVTYSGGFAQVAERFERRFSRLNALAREVSGPEKEAWLGLLCQYYQASIQTPQHCGESRYAQLIALQRCQTALQIARELDDAELLAAGYFRLSGIYESHGNLLLARESILQGMQYVDRVRDPTRGNLYLRAATISARFAEQDETLIALLRDWQDEALQIVYRGEIEPDRSFFRLNRAAVHHERARTFLRFALARPEEKIILLDAQSEMQLARDALPADLAIWRMYFLVTEARLYLASHDLEGGARLALAALRAAREMQSKKGERQVCELFQEMRRQDEHNPYVCNLGVELGLF